ncbi:DUF5630 domain-containing protein [Legionella parisiensis]|uniref:Uncharacterized protein n=1 Tax=Legionella parisiensis TaxID=45071 RepID=A0A1E5JMV0_9GAMM|nr:DUF5630 domain-containing protein [Legionella parisiensis]KTD42281.1 hypothetical protein Lpar_3598 [Legionella parisiensis]OEH45834.1 hypothetical protein lpari_03153 [Legionella parisiensis]STX72350.1 Uncharacterised protein [Legionella parisiensis]
MYKFFDFKTLNQSLKLTGQDRLFIYMFNQANDEDKLKLIRNQNIETIVRIAYNTQDVETFCNCAELREYWGKIWCAYGVVLSQQKNLPLLMFYSHSQSSQFDLVRGAYFYHRSQEARKSIKQEFGFSEIESVRMAIQYGSVHAIQRYNEYLYYKLEQANSEESPALYQELIANSKLMLPNYGSYGYMVLADAIGRYCFWLLKHHDIAKSETEYKHVLQALDNAELILKESKYSIQNASIGIGLKYSNSMGFELPSQAKDFFIGYYEKSIASLEDPGLFTPGDI